MQTSTLSQQIVSSVIETENQLVAIKKILTVDSTNLTRANFVAEIQKLKSIIVQLDRNVSLLLDNPQNLDCKTQQFDKENLNAVASHNVYKKWTPKEHRLFVELLKRGTSAKDIALMLDKSENSVAAKINRTICMEYNRGQLIEDIVKNTRIEKHVVESAIALRNVGKNWSQIEETLLIQELKSGLTFKEIAAAHMRKEGGIKARTAMLVCKTYRQGASIENIQNMYHVDEAFITEALAYEAKKENAKQTRLEHRI